jgi:hypothetical protein
VITILYYGISRKHQNNTIYLSVYSLTAYFMSLSVIETVLGSDMKTATPKYGTEPLPTWFQCLVSEGNPESMLTLNLRTKKQKQM